VKQEVVGGGQVVQRVAGAVVCVSGCGQEARRPPARARAAAAQLRFAMQSPAAYPPYAPFTLPFAARPSRPAMRVSLAGSMQEETSHHAML